MRVSSKAAIEKTEDYNRNALDLLSKLYPGGRVSEVAEADKINAKLPLEKRFKAYSLSGLGVALEYQRMDMRPVSADLEEKADRFGYEFEHLAVTLGSVIHNIDLKDDLTDEQISFIRQTLLERKVIFFHNQGLSEDQQVQFGKRFGTLDAFPFGPPGQNPYLFYIHHNENRPGSENNWHTDVTWMENPSLGSIAQVDVAPPIGGSTLFSDSHAAYLGLSADLKARLQHIHGINDYRVFMQKYPKELHSEIKQKVPFGVSHPLLRTHPETGKTALYIHLGFIRPDSLFDVRTGETLPPDECKDIIRQLSLQHGREEYVCRFKYEAGSIAFWDNRAVQHYAASDYWPHERILRRVTISGDRPYYDPSQAPSCYQDSFMN